MCCLILKITEVLRFYNGYVLGYVLVGNYFLNCCPREVARQQALTFPICAVLS